MKANLKEELSSEHIALINPQIVHITFLNNYHFSLPTYINTLHLETIGWEKLFFSK